MGNAIIPLLVVALAAADTPAWVGRFADPGPVPAPWSMVPLKGEKPTSYRIAAVAGRCVLLQNDSNASDNRFGKFDRRR